LLPAVAASARALEVAERMRAAVEALAIPHERQPHSPVLTVSLGVAIGPAGAERHTDVVMAADEALLRAKQAGRNRVAAARQT
jgi:diguanylate cyclase (GGDEF)-like protein